ncbi:MAG: LacI family DNA-binding transcriptional regulator [Anaerolineae bacterium]|nr:LacI family DNA-binding transcriptional regulator [Anaerolineae bacterium]
MPSPATLHDVAKLAGVSYQTVSRVVNRSPNVSTRTMEKVNRAIADLNYQPNRAARSLVTGKSNAIHVLAFDIHNLRTLPAMQHGAYSQGYQLRLSGFQRNEDAVRDLRACLRDIAASQVDGMLLILPWVLVTESELSDLMGKIPYVVVGSSLGYGTNAVLVDQREGMRMAAQHLLDLGHRRIAAIQGIEHYYDAQLRQETLEKVLRKNGLELVASERGLFEMVSGYEAALRLLANGPDFTALVCANDEMALGAIRAIKSQGLRVPQDVSVIGFDDLPFAIFSDPPLTTIRQDFNALGTLGLQHLLSLIRTPDIAPHQRLLYPELIVRESTATLTSPTIKGRS